LLTRPLDGSMPGAVRRGDEELARLDESAIAIACAVRIADAAAGDQVRRLVVLPVPVEMVSDECIVGVSLSWLPVKQLSAPVTGVRPCSDLLVEHETAFGHGP